MKNELQIDIFLVLHVENPWCTKKVRKIKLENKTKKKLQKKNPNRNQGEKYSIDKHQQGIYKREMLNVDRMKIKKKIEKLFEMMRERDSTMSSYHLFVEHFPFNYNYMRTATFRHNHRFVRILQFFFYLAFGYIFFLWIFLLLHAIESGFFIMFFPCQSCRVNEQFSILFIIPCSSSCQHKFNIWSMYIKREFYRNIGSTIIWNIEWNVFVIDDDDDDYTAICIQRGRIFFFFFFESFFQASNHNLCNSTLDANMKTCTEAKKMLSVELVHHVRPCWKIYRQWSNRNSSKCEKEKFFFGNISFHSLRLLYRIQKCN